MAYVLRIYRNQEKILGVYAQDDTEYSAIYIKNEDGGVTVASNLADINGDVWDETEWHQALEQLLVLYGLVWFYRVEDLPEEVLDKHEQWLDQARS